MKPGHTVRYRFFFLVLLTSLSGQLARAQSTILWEVTHPESKHVSYLIGTYHQLGNWFADSIPYVLDKVTQAELAIFESIDTSDTRNQRQILSRPSTTAYQKGLGRKHARALDEIAKDWPYQPDKLTATETLFKLQQTFYKTQCGNARPTDTWNHFDDYLQFRATEQGIALHGLETDSAQISLINQNSGQATWKKEKKRVIFWMAALRGEKDNKRLCTFTREYRNFDLDYELTEACEGDVILEQRNRTWMKTLPDMLRAQNCVVAVGLYHLYFQCGLVTQLRAQGFVVEPVLMKQ